MSLPFLVAVDAPRIDNAIDGLDWRILSYLGSIFTKVDPANVDQAYDFLSKTHTEFPVPLAIHLDVTTLTSVEDVVSLLDAGAAQVFVSQDQLSALRGDGGGDIGLDRIVLKVDAATHQEADGQSKTAAEDGNVCVYYENVQDLDQLKKRMGASSSDSRSPSYFSISAETKPRMRQLLSDPRQTSAIPVIAASELTIDGKEDASKIPVQSLLQVTSDRPDGLFSTLVTDERGVALGLVYSNMQSIEESLKTGRGVYHSRKRGLWYKGESSGDVQELLRVQLDCDRDCLNFVVRQKGKGASDFQWSESI